MFGNIEIKEFLPKSVLMDTFEIKSMYDKPKYILSDDTIFYVSKRYCSHSISDKGYYIIIDTFLIDDKNKIVKRTSFHSGYFYTDNKIYVDNRKLVNKCNSEDLESIIILLTSKHE